MGGKSPYYCCLAPPCYPVRAREAVKQPVTARDAPSCRSPRPRQEHDHRPKRCEPYSTAPISRIATTRGVCQRPSSQHDDVGWQTLPQPTPRQPQQARTLASPRPSVSASSSTLRTTSTSKARKPKPTPAAHTLHADVGRLLSRTGGDFAASARVALSPVRRHECRSGRQEDAWHMWLRRDAALVHADRGRFDLIHLFPRHLRRAMRLRQ